MSLLSFVSFFSCTRVPPANDGTVNCIVQTRIDQHVAWQSPKCAQLAIQDLLDQELTPEVAIQIALLNNPQIQSFFEELGIAQADLIEAGLLSNPAFEISARYPDKKGFKVDIEYFLTTSLLDFLLIPIRTRVAATEFEQTKLKVANAILDLALEVRETYLALLCDRQKIDFTRSVRDLADIQREIASKQNKIGNLNNLDFQISQSRFLEADLELARSETEIIRLKEKLYRLLGLACYIPLNLPESIVLEDDDECSFEECELIAFALAERLDLQVARFEVMRLRQSLGLNQSWTYTQLQGGIAGERDSDGLNTLGPTFSGEIPLFNYGQAARKRLYAKLRQAQDKLAALEIQVSSEVREAHALTTRYKTILDEYKSRMVPLQSTILASSEELYNVMGLGVNKLIDVKSQELTVFQQYNEVLKQYFLARVQLDRALGGNMTMMETDESN